MTFLDSHPLRAALCANLLERLAARIVEQGEELLQDAGVAFPARAVSTVLLLGEQGQMSAADIAKSLGQPHQLVTQRIDLLMELGVVARIEDPKDARRKFLSLTPTGRRQFQKLNASLARADAAFATLFREIGCDLSSVALKAMVALDRSSILARAASLKKKAQS